MFTCLGCFTASLPTRSVVSLRSLPNSVSPLLAGCDSRVNREHQLQLDFLGAALSMITLYPLRRRSGTRTSLPPAVCVRGGDRRPATGTRRQAIKVEGEDDRGSRRRGLLLLVLDLPLPPPTPPAPSSATCSCLALLNQAAGDGRRRRRPVVIV